MDTLTKPRGNQIKALEENLDFLRKDAKVVSLSEYRRLAQELLSLYTQEVKEHLDVIGKRSGKER